MPGLRSIVHYARAVLIAVGFGDQLKIHHASAEEQSILIGATVDDSDFHPGQNTSPIALIDGGFMSIQTSTFQDACDCGLKEFVVELKRQYTIVSAFAHMTNSMHSVSSHIWIGNDYPSLTQSSWSINDSGFFFIKPPLSSNALEITPKTGKLVSIRRDGYNSMGKSSQKNKIKWFELRLY